MMIHQYKLDFSLFKALLLVVATLSGALGLFPAVANAAEFPDQEVIMILGFDGKAWHPYTLNLPPKRGNAKQGVIKRRHWKKLKSIVDPIALTRQSGTGDIFVKDNAGQLKHFVHAEQHLLPLPDKEDLNGSQNYTQLRAYDSGLVMVQLLAGKSRDTQLLNYDTHNKNKSAKPYSPLIKQAAAQFHPLMHQELLFYGHVSCRLACDPVIQEIWQQNLITGKAEQLTLLNATSYLHSVDRHNRFGFISSNQHGYYHIARLDRDSKALIWLTHGQVTDSFPSVASNGDLFFIRRTPQGSRLMKLNDAIGESALVADRVLETVVLPKGVKKIRYLELSAQ